MTPLYTLGGHFNMAAVSFSFLTIDARSSPIFQIREIKVQLPISLPSYYCKEVQPERPRLGTARINFHLTRSKNTVH